MAQPARWPSRPQIDETPSESLHAGCPMLVHAAAAHPVFPDRTLMRCQLGWALRDELDRARCRAVNAVPDCWQAHPERTPLVALPGTERSLDTTERASAD
jgi:hypothetical protein